MHVLQGEPNFDRWKAELEAPYKPPQTASSAKPTPRAHANTMSDYPELTEKFEALGAILRVRPGLALLVCCVNREEWSTACNIFICTVGQGITQCTVQLLQVLALQRYETEEKRVNLQLYLYDEVSYIVAVILHVCRLQTSSFQSCFAFLHLAFMPDDI